MWVTAMRTVAGGRTVHGHDSALSGATKCLLQGNFGYLIRQ